MTEAERLRGLDQPEWMLQELLADKPSRKLFLVGVAFCYHFAHTVADPRARQALDSMERWADSRRLADLRSARTLALRSVRWIESLGDGRRGYWDPARNSREMNASMAIRSLTVVDRSNPFSHVLIFGDATASNGTEKSKLRTHLASSLCDAFRTRWLPVTLDPRWLAASVLDLARAIYDERAFDRMPVLADAMMDAGCDNEEVIAQCRGSGSHVRGCWVVDLLTGRS